VKSSAKQSRPLPETHENQEIELEDAVSVPDGDETKPEVPISADDFEGPGLGGVREILAAQPDRLESGLVAHSDERGSPIGVGFATDVGEIDLLARDASGAFVVVMIGAGEASEDLVREMLLRIGWVRKHMVGNGERVRGTVLLDSKAGDLSYVAAAVADTVAFKTYRLSLVFEDLTP